MSIHTSRLYIFFLAFHFFRVVNAILFPCLSFTLMSVSSSILSICISLQFLFSLSICVFCRSRDERYSLWNVIILLTMVFFFDRLPLSLSRSSISYALWFGVSISFATAMAFVLQCHNIIFHFIFVRFNSNHLAFCCNDNKSTHRQGKRKTCPFVRERHTQCW